VAPDRTRNDAAAHRLYRDAGFVDSLRLTGDATACRALPGRLDVSPLAAVERAAVSLPR
jgi:hypothetical protein